MSSAYKSYVRCRETVIEVLKKPLTLRALKRRANEAGRITVVIPVSLSDLLGNDIDDLNNLADERILAEDLVASLSDIYYQAVGVTRDSSKGDYLAGTILLRVNADVSDIINQ